MFSTAVIIVYQFIVSIFIGVTMPVLIKPNPKIRHIHVVTSCSYYIPFLIMVCYTSGDISYLSKFYIFIAVLIGFIFYKAKLINHLFSFFIIYFSIIACECATIFIMVILRVLFPDLGLEPYFILERGNLNSCIVYIPTITICYLVINKIIIPSIHGYTKLMNMRIALLLSLPPFISLVSGNIIYFDTETFRKYIMIFVGGVVFMGCCAVLYYGLNRLKAHNYQILKNKYEKERLEAINSHVKLLQSNYNEVRKGNHDIANHLLSLSYLLAQGDLQKADAYIEDLLKQLKEVAE